MKYPEYKAVNYAEIADQILEFWSENEIFEKSIKTKEGNPTFTFFEGPPSATEIFLPISSFVIPKFFSTCNSTGKPWVSHPPFLFT